MGCFGCFDGGIKRKEQGPSAEDADQKSAREKAAEAAQKRQEEFAKTPAGRAARAQMEAIAKQPAMTNNRGEPALKWQMG